MDINLNLYNFWLPLVFIIQLYYFLPNKKIQNLFLLGISYLFYASIHLKFLPLILISTLTDYLAGFMVTPKRKKTLRVMGLSLSLSINLGLLFFFKYIPDMVFSYQETESTHWIKTLVLPLGISYYTFQTISYTIDCYRGYIKPTANFIDFSLYVSFFPQLSAGPIERARNLLPQFQVFRKFNLFKFKEGFYLILLGLFKKIYVEAAITHPLNLIFNPEETTASLAVFGGVLSITHFYINFSAYSDLARGLGKFFGIDIMRNFNPFIFSKNPLEFWRNWHISLYRWITNYLIKPIIKLKKFKSYSFYILILMLAIALWHKASINMVIAGVFNGLSILMYRFVFKTNLFINKIPIFFKVFCSILFMFLFHSVQGILYYLESFNQTKSFILKILKFNGFDQETFNLLIYFIPFFLPLLIYEWFQHKHKTELFIMKSPLIIRALWIAFVLACIIIFERDSNSNFEYMGF